MRDWTVCCRIFQKGGGNAGDFPMRCQTWAEESVLRVSAHAFSDLNCNRLHHRWIVTLSLPVFTLFNPFSAIPPVFHHKQTGSAGRRGNSHSFRNALLSLSRSKISQDSCRPRTAFEYVRIPHSSFVRDRFAAQNSTS